MRGRISYQQRLIAADWFNFSKPQYCTHNRHSQSCSFYSDDMTDWSNHPTISIEQNPSWEGSQETPCLLWGL